MSSSSGNPFRRKQPTLENVSHTEPTLSFDEAIKSAFQDNSRKASTSKKSVRIQTPEPLSPDPISPEEGSPLIRRVSNKGHTGSPPPLSPVDGAPAVGTGQLEQPRRRLGDAIDFQDAEVIDNTRRNSETPVVPPPSASTITNPFQKTLATIEPKDTRSLGKGEDRDEHDESLGAKDATSSRPAGVLDVDSFTRMLMTGQDPNPSRNTTGPTSDGIQLADQRPDSSSGNFVSSPSYDTPQESTSSAKPVKPPLSKHRHSTFVNDKGPRTISFDDLDTDATDSPRNPSKTSTTISGEPRQLSPAPMRRSESASKTTSSENKNQASTTGSDSRRSAPPVPLARRNTAPQKSQTIAGSIPRSESPSSGSIRASKTTQQPSRASKPPPPPPARRGANRNSMPPDQVSASDVLNPSSGSTSVADDYSSLDSTNVKRSLNVPGSSRSSSISERAVAPPPPPPTRRQRGSSKGSMEPPSGSRSPNDARRMSVELNKRGSLEIAQRMSSLSQVSEDGQGSGQQQPDVLANLSALQAEVEELRNQYRRPG